MKIKKLSFDSHIHKEIKISSNPNTFTENDDKIISLGKGFYFHLKTEQLFCDNVEINFTKIELQLFKLLVSNLNNITKIEDIAELIWRKKNFSRISLRAYIKKIRDKTYSNLIVNKSNIGYKIVGNVILSQLSNNIRTSNIFGKYCKEEFLMISPTVYLGITDFQKNNIKFDCVPFLCTYENKFPLNRL